ncbi:MAG: protein kinase [Clostridia bacterium]|nr:protein kinase [Clostridia bacterium]
METRLIGKIVSRRFRIEEVIGRGGMSLVYRAFDLKTHQTVAVKVLREEYEDDREYKERFEREADVCKRLSHPNIVNLIASGTAGGISYITMEYVDGQTLKEIIDERGRLPQEEAVHYALQILAALAHAHQRGIIHRDIKPQNMMVTKNGQLKVTDFGIAGIANSDTLTTDGTVIGSVHYFSPEQAKGMKATSASDLYSVGIILYEMLTGHVPFNGESAVAVAMMHLMQEPEPLENQVEVSTAIAGIVHHALKKSVQDRYQSAYEMSSDLRRALRHPDGLFLQRKLPVVHERREKISPLLISIIAVLIAAIGFTGWQLYRTMFVLTTVPEITGMMLSDARENLEMLGLNADVMYTYSELPEGIVVDQNPDASTETERGSKITIAVSLGSGTVSIPRLIGYTLNEALDIAAAQGFNVVSTVFVPSELLKGTVISQDPAPGVSGIIGADVSLVVSGSRVIVPDFTGVRLEEALRQVEEVGLTKGENKLVDVDSARQDNVVQSQNLEPFTEVLPGSIIDFEIGYYEKRKYTSDIVVDLTGAADGANIRITLMESDGNEYDMYSGQKDEDYLTVTLRSDTSGLKNWRLYLDGNFMQEASAVLR